MEGIRLYLWIVFYILQLWLVSVTVFLPAIIAWLSQERKSDNLTIAKALLPRLRRYQIIAVILFGSVVTSSSSNLMPGQWGRAIFAIADAAPFLFYLGIVGLVAGIVGMVWLSRSAKRGALATNAGWIGAIGNFCYLLLLVVTSSTLFPAFGTVGIELNGVDILFRLLHVIFSAIVLTGAELALVTRMLSHGQTDIAERSARIGQKWMLVGSSVQIITGFALLLLVGMKVYPVPAGHILLTFGILFAIGVVIMSAMSLGKTGSIVKLARGTAMTAMLTIFLMGALRVVHIKTKYEAAKSPVNIETTK